MRQTNRDVCLSQFSLSSQYTKLSFEKLEYQSPLVSAMLAICYAKIIIIFYYTNVIFIVFYHYFLDVLADLIPSEEMP